MRRGHSDEVRKSRSFVHIVFGCFFVVVFVVVFCFFLHTLGALIV